MDRATPAATASCGCTSGSRTGSPAGHPGGRGDARPDERDRGGAGGPAYPLVTYVTGGIVGAMAQAKTAAGDRNVLVLGAAGAGGRGPGRSADPPDPGAAGPGTPDVRRLAVARRAGRSPGDRHTGGHPHPLPRPSLTRAARDPFTPIHASHERRSRLLLPVDGARRSLLGNRSTLTWCATRPRIVEHERAENGSAWSCRTRSSARTRAPVIAGDWYPTGNAPDSGLSGQIPQRRTPGSPVSWPACGRAGFGVLYCCTPKTSNAICNGGRPAGSALKCWVVHVRLVVFGAGAPQQGFACVTQLPAGCFHELRAKLPLTETQGWCSGSQ